MTTYQLVNDLTLSWVQSIVPWIPAPLFIPTVTCWLQNINCLLCKQLLLILHPEEWIITTDGSSEKVICIHPAEKQGAILVSGTRVGVCGAMLELFAHTHTQTDTLILCAEKIVQPTSLNTGWIFRSVSSQFTVSSQSAVGFWLQADRHVSYTMSPRRDNHNFLCCMKKTDAGACKHESSSEMRWWDWWQQKTVSSALFSTYKSIFKPLCCCTSYMIKERLLLN